MQQNNRILIPWSLLICVQIMVGWSNCVGHLTHVPDHKRVHRKQYLHLKLLKATYSVHILADIFTSPQICDVNDNFNKLSNRNRQFLVNLIQKCASNCAQYNRYWYNWNPSRFNILNHIFTSNCPMQVCQPIFIEFPHLLSYATLVCTRTFSLIYWYRNPAC